MNRKELKSEQFFRLYNAAQKRIYAYLLMFVHNHSDADDLLQETASILWEQFDQFNQEGSFAAWAIGIARNKALDLLKSKRGSRPLFDDEFYKEISKYAEAESENADKRLKALRNCIQKMSEQNQHLIHLRFDQGITVKKLSQASRYSADAIYKKMSRIYSMLHDCINRTLFEWGQM
ncbi:MAG TPA: sigma-70 family RNA polymerase sigma factor [Anaerohalosphaeraceae bacterium]|nr:sigma-70 family RNA polymerase sigma factor [Anaerohalosphaeraceae bacterium]